MAEIAPNKVPAAGTVSNASPNASPRRGPSAITRVLLGIVYIILVPVVAAIGLAGAATYFPEPTSALLGPVFRAIMGQAGAPDIGETVSRVESAEERLAKIEEDVATLTAGLDSVEAAMAETSPVTPGGGAEGTGEGQDVAGADAEELSKLSAALTSAVDESTSKDHMLAALTALTLARTEYAYGNRANAERELALARTAMEGAGETQGLNTADLNSAFDKAQEALSQNSATAHDWLSLAWHTLAESLASGE